MYVARIIFATECHEHLAFSSWNGAQDYLRGVWSCQYDFGGGMCFHHITSIAIFEVEDCLEPKAAIASVEDGDKAKVRLLELRDAAWIEQARWELTGKRPFVF